MNIFIAGSGNIGSALAKTIAKQGYDAVVLKRGWERNPPCAGILFLALPDNLVEEVIEKLYRDIPKKLIIIHFAGVLRLEKKGVFLLHPYTSVNKESDLSAVLFTLWGEENQVVLKTLKDIGVNYIFRKGAPSEGYHTSAVFAGNFFQHLIFTGRELLINEGFNKDQSDLLLRQLVQSSMENILKHGIEGMTGPAVRGDNQTIAAEISFLEKRSPVLAETYKFMTEKIKEAINDRHIL